jgi:DNA-binding IclR family transcriptional regulator
MQTVRNGEQKMTRLSPAVGRIISVLNFFAEHPQQAFTLTQIVKSLRLSRATCHALLVGLVEGGYLYRNPDKSYVLGPALLALARNAQQHFSPLDVARQEMRALADELDVVSAALFQDRDEIVTRERAASLSHLGWAPPPGQRYPMYPWGNVFIAALPRAEVEAWMDKANPPPSEEERRDAHRQIEFFGENGYLVGVFRDDNDRQSTSVGEDASRRQGGRFLAELDPTRTYYLQFLTAPVMSDQGKVAFALALYGFRRAYTGAEVAIVGERLCDACARITGFITGKKAPAQPGRTAA